MIWGHCLKIPTKEAPLPPKKVMNGFSNFVTVPFEQWFTQSDQEFYVQGH